MSHKGLNGEPLQSARSPRVLPLWAASKSDEWESESDQTGNGFSASFRLGKIESTSHESLGIGEGESLDYEIENIKSGGLGGRSSDRTEQNFLLYTPDEEQSVIAKFDRRLVLFIALLYMLSFLDRSSRFIALTKSTAQLIDCH